MPAPTNTVSPVVFGTATVGYLLSSGNGSWTNSPTSYTYQWTRAGSNIGGATAVTYETVSADVGNAVGCTVTATNGSGSNSQASSNTFTIVAGMVLTNATLDDYWFGPRHLAGGLGSTVTLDVTSDTALYLKDDAVADAVNTLVQSQKVTVTSGAPTPFPRPTGVPTLLHGDGSPQGKVYSPQGSLYLRRDNTGGATTLLAKTSGVTFNTGWASIQDPWTGFNQSLGLQASTFPLYLADQAAGMTSERAFACGVWLNAGTLITGLVVNYIGTSATLTGAYFGIYNSSYQLVAVTANTSSSFGATAEWVRANLTSTYTVPASGFYYFAFIFVGSATPAVTYVGGAGSNASQQNVPTTGTWPYWEGSGTTDTTLITTASPSLSLLAPWIGAY